MHVRAVGVIMHMDLKINGPHLYEAGVEVDGGRGRDYGQQLATSLNHGA